jgi:septal ring factor EnvC (AmiA/AmiB activator)
MPIKAPPLDESVSRAHALNARNHSHQSLPGLRGPSPSGAVVVVSEPEPQEITFARNRTTLNMERATRELDPYIKERRLVERRITELSTEIERIRVMLDRFRLPLQDSNRRLYSSNETQKRRKKQKQKHIFRLHTLYATEVLQKQEEVMRLRDHLQEINENMETILRNYEDMRTLADINRGGQFIHARKHAHKHARKHAHKHTRKHTRRHKWSLKYKRSIDCRHPKGFSQRQHCTYGTGGSAPRKPPTGDSVPRKPPHRGLCPP